MTKFTRIKFIGIQVAMIVLLFNLTALSQTPPKVRNVGSRVVEMSNMVGTVAYMKCWKTKGLIVGKVIKRNFEDDQMTIASIVVRDANDERHIFNVNQDQISLLGHYANSYVSSLLKLNNRVKVYSFMCSGGGSGLFPYANRIIVY